jgi:hypothetical protein
VQIRFTTKEGSEWLIDHAEHSFTQLKPRRRKGHLWNLPSVLVGKKVVICTPNIEGKHPSIPLRMIETAVVTSRRVSLG